MLVDGYTRWSECIEQREIDRQWMALDSATIALQLRTIGALTASGNGFEKAATINAAAANTWQGKYEKASRANSFWRTFALVAGATLGLTIIAR